MEHDRSFTEENREPKEIERYLQLKPDMYEAKRMVESYETFDPDSMNYRKHLDAVERNSKRDAWRREARYKDMSDQALDAKQREMLEDNQSLENERQAAVGAYYTASEILKDVVHRVRETYEHQVLLGYEVESAHEEFNRRRVKEILSDADLNPHLKFAIHYLRPRNETELQVALEKGRNQQQIAEMLSEQDNQPVVYFDSRGQLHSAWHTVQKSPAITVSKDRYEPWDSIDLEATHYASLEPHLGLYWSDMTFPICLTDRYNRYDALDARLIVDGTEISDSAADTEPATKPTFVIGQEAVGAIVTHSLVVANQDQILKLWQLCSPRFLDLAERIETQYTELIDNYKSGYFRRMLGLDDSVAAGFERTFERMEHAAFHACLKSRADKIMLHEIIEQHSAEIYASYRKSPGLGLRPNFPEKIFIASITQIINDYIEINKLLPSE